MYRSQQLFFILTITVWFSLRDHVDIFSILKKLGIVG